MNPLDVKGVTGEIWKVDIKMKKDHELKTHKNMHTSPAYVISRLSSEIAYVQKRMCIRKSSECVQQYLKESAACVEAALHQALKDERNGY